MKRPRGWIQDVGSLLNSFKIVEIFDSKSGTYNDLVNRIIPSKIKDETKRSEILIGLKKINGKKNLLQIKYKDLIGTRTRNNEVNSIIQALIPGQNRLGIVDWACDNYLRFIYTLGFVNYNEENDSFHITNLGLKLTNAINNEAKYELLKNAFLKYPPLIRVLELLYDQLTENPLVPSLTKFEIGKNLGFKGEDGFTTYSQEIFLQALNSSTNKKEKSKIRQNWEGSSDKYARMICSWMTNDFINWVKPTKKSVSVKIGNDLFSDVLQSYQITSAGINAFNSSRSKSSKKGTTKNVFFEMLATKGPDTEFIRLRRTYILNCIKYSRTINQIKKYLKTNFKHDISHETIIDDIKNLTRIGLQIKESNNSIKLIDKIDSLVIPKQFNNSIILPSNIEFTKQELRRELNSIDHSFLDLLDFSIAGQIKARIFEIRIVELLSLVLISKHLSGGNRPEIIAYFPKTKPTNGVIMDSKSYMNGFSIPAPERDKMVRYITEYETRDSKLNNNKWWENFKDNDYPTKKINFCFVSSNFIGKYLDQIRYISNRTKTNGSAISAVTLLKRINSILDVKSNYNLKNFFIELSGNNLIS